LAASDFKNEKKSIQDNFMEPRHGTESYLNLISPLQKGRKRVFPCPLTDHLCDPYTHFYKSYSLIRGGLKIGYGSNILKIRHLEDLMI
jgi:hypothetical protein